MFFPEQVRKKTYLPKIYKNSTRCLCLHIIIKKSDEDSMDGGDIGLFITVYPKIFVGFTTLGTFILRVYVDYID